MRFGRIVAGTLLLLVAGGAGLHFALGEESPLPALVQTGRFVAGGDRTLEDVAEQWFDPANRADPDSARGNGTALGVAIRVGRLEALRSGAEPVPDHLKRQFAKHYPAKVLAETRWLVAAPDSRLGRILARWPVEEGAVTLGDVIVFKTARAARDRRLFAHELAHVVQYRELGIGEFARRYARDPKPMEAEAEAKARRVERALG